MSTKPRIEVTVTFTSTWEYDPEQFEDEDEARQEIVNTIKPYLESPEGTLYADYGPNAWGGYDGPTYIAGDVQRA